MNRLIVRVLLSVKEDEGGGVQDMDVMEVEEVEDEEELEGTNCPWDVATQTEKEVENMEDIDHNYYSDKSERDLAVREKTAKLRNMRFTCPRNGCGRFPIRKKE